MDAAAAADKSPSHLISLSISLRVSEPVCLQTKSLILQQSEHSQLIGRRKVRRNKNTGHVPDNLQSSGTFCSRVRGGAGKR